MLDARYWILDKRRNYILIYPASLRFPGPYPAAGGSKQWDITSINSSVCPSLAIGGIRAGEAELRLMYECSLKYPASGIQYHFAKHITAYGSIIFRQKRKFLSSQVSSVLLLKLHYSNTFLFTIAELRMKSIIKVDALGVANRVSFLGGAHCVF